MAAGAALVLLGLIGLFTHLFYEGRIGFHLIAPAPQHLGVLSVLIPVVGGLLIGGMAYWGSERIRGHGIPEAMETILVGGSKVEPSLAVLKPISSAISIGTGGPFGAEGPIILTGGAFGSIIAQFIHLSATERRTLLVAGACAGMAAVFGTPVAATLFGVELLVFEFRPRSMVPIALAVSMATGLRAIMAAHSLILPAPLFPVPSQPSVSMVGLGSACLIGLGGAALAVVLTTAVYGAEDLFKKLPIHWAWWPAIGGVVIGIGGLVDPRALGVGYGNIGDELAGRMAMTALLLLLVTKLVIWAVALGSGTSGGILAPLLMIGGAMGALVAPFLPGGDTTTWALVGLGATLAGVTRSPFTAIVFSLELTHDVSALPALLAACAVSHLISSGLLRRSILTEKVARRGFHVVREYASEPLEALFVREAMVTEVMTLSREQPVLELHRRLTRDPKLRHQRLYPVLDGGVVAGVATRSDLLEAVADGRRDATVGEVLRQDVVVAHPDETLRSAADRMAEHWLGALPVVGREDGRLHGVLTEFNLLKARQRQLVEERHRERIFRLPFSRLLVRRPVIAGTGRLDGDDEEVVDDKGR
ncbi:MAG TPA: chloride channel protein [Candidatus Dormibacteraeota bacterium]|nr:chloride channel protein [Candidatus Dormibacteraeota bacterium]